MDDGRPRGAALRRTRCRRCRHSTRPATASNARKRAWHSDGERRGSRSVPIETGKSLASPRPWSRDLPDRTHLVSRRTRGAPTLRHRRYGSPSTNRCPTSTRSRRRCVGEIQAAWSSTSRSRVRRGRRPRSRLTALLAQPVRPRAWRPGGLSRSTAYAIGTLILLIEMGTFQRREDEDAREQREDDDRGVGHQPPVDSREQPPMAARSASTHSVHRAIVDRVERTNQPRAEHCDVEPAAPILRRCTEAPRRTSGRSNEEASPASPGGIAGEATSPAEGSGRVQFVGMRTGAPLSLTRKTTNFAGLVLLALRPTVWTSVGPS